MSLRDEVQSGRYDGLMIRTATPRTTLERSDAFFEAEGRAMARAIVGGKLDPAAMFDAPLREAVLYGPGGSDPIANVGTSQSVGITAEDAGWTRVGASDSLASAAFSPSSREQMVRYLYWTLAHNPIAANIIGHYENLTIGDGFKVIFKTDSARERWKQIAKEVKFGRRVRKFIAHSYLLGEWFTMILPLSKKVTKGKDGKLVAGSDLGRSSDLPRKLRGLGPEQIVRIVCQGDAEYDKGATPDAENVIAYERPGNAGFLAAGDILHHKWQDIGNMTRGSSVLYCVLRYLRMLEKFVENRHWVNFMRARIPLIRKVAGGPDRIRGESGRVSSLPAPGTMITEGMSTSYEFPPLNLEAEDARYDGRTLAEMVAAGVKLPLYFILSNPAETNYAGLMAMDSPVIAMFEGLQEDFWIPDIVHLVNELTGEGDDQFRVRSGSVMKRNQKVIAETAAPLLDRNVISKTTVRSWLDLDPEEEADLVAEEIAEDGGMQKTNGNHGDGTDAIPAKRGRPAKSEKPGEVPGSPTTRRPRPSA